MTWTEPEDVSAGTASSADFNLQVIANLRLLQATLGLVPSLGTYYVAPQGPLNSTAVASTKDQLVYVPVVLPAGTLDYLAIYVVTGQASTGVRFGVYSDVNGFPSAKLFGSAATTATTTGSSLKSENPGLAVTGGRYWLAMVTQGGTTQPSVSILEDSTEWRIPLLGAANTSNLDTLMACGTTGAMTNYETGVTGTLPSTATPANFSHSTKVPIIGYRVS